MDAETRETLIQAFKQGRETEEWHAGIYDNEGVYQDHDGPNGSKVWFVAYDRDGEGSTSNDLYFKFHHVQLANGKNYDTPPAGGATTESGPTTAPIQYGDAKQKKIDVINKARELQAAAGKQPMGPTQDASGQVRPVSLGDLSSKKLKSLFNKAQEYIDGYNSDIKVIERARGFQKTAGETQLGQSYNGINLTPTPTTEINAKQANRLANKAKAYIDDYKTDLADIRTAKGMQKENEDKILIKDEAGNKVTKNSKVNIANFDAKQADTLADQARSIIAQYNTKQNSGDKLPKSGSSTDNTNTGSAPGGGSDTADNGVNGVGNSGNHGGEGLEKAKNVHGKMKNVASGGNGGNSNSSFAPDPNGNNLTARFAKVYGAAAQDKLDQAIIAFNQSQAGVATIVEENKGQYGRSYKLIDKSGQVITANTDELKDKLTPYSSASAAISEIYPNNPDTAVSLTRAGLSNTSAGGNMTGLTRRIANAYTGGDLNKATQLIAEVVSKHPGALTLHNPGQDGSYVSLSKANGQSTNNSDEVVKYIASRIRVDGAKPVAYNQQSRQQQAVLSGANGMAVMNRLNLALNIAPGSTDRLSQAIAQYNAKNDKDIKVHGTLGQPGFYLSLKTANGQISGTNAILNKLQPYAGTRSTAPLPPPPPAAPAVPPVGDPGATPPPASDGGDGTGGSDSGDGGNSGSSGSDGAQGTDGTNGQNQSQKPDNKPKGSVDNGSKEKEKATADILSISAAAQKSQAILGADLNNNGTLSKKELAPYKPADRNNSGTVSKKELKQYVSAANTDGVAGVSKPEAQVFKAKDVNNNNKVSKVENKAYGLVAGADGNATKKEARDYLKQQAERGAPDKKVDKTAEQLAMSILNKPSGRLSGGAQNNDNQAALAGGAGQMAKSKNGKDNDGTGKKKNKKN